MLIVPEGYKLAVITPDGQVADTIELEDYNLDNPVAAVTIAAEIAAVVHAVRAARAPEAVA